MSHFTSDWFTKYAPQWISRMGHLKDVETHALEIGSYEGRSTCWILDNILTHARSSITCVDSWDGSDKTLGLKTVSAHSRFVSNVIHYYGKVRKIAKKSYDALLTMNIQCYEFDIIFIDGDHEGYGALSDLMMCWPLLKNGGHLVFDDYQWSHEALRTQPKDAWDAFASVKPLGLTWQLDGRQIFARKNESIL